MEFRLIDKNHQMWEEMIDYARKCSWKTADRLAELMEEDTFADWERLLVAVEGNQILGFCTLTRKDTYPELPYSPFIGFVYVTENERGHRLSEQMIEEGSRYLKRWGFEKVYIVTDHEGLYEKFGFDKCDRLERPNEAETVFSRDL